MDSKLDLIIEELVSINKKLEILNEKLEIVYKDCSKMSDHIDFINLVYEKLKYPLNCITKLYIR